MFSQIPSCLCTEAGEQLPRSEPSHLAGQEVMPRLWCCQQQHPAAPSSRTGSWSQVWGPWQLLLLPMMFFAKPSPSRQSWQRFQMGFLLPHSLPCSCDTLSGVVYSKHEDLLLILAPRLLELPLPPSLVYPHSGWDYSKRWLREHRAIRSLQALARMVTNPQRHRDQSAESPPGPGRAGRKGFWMGNRGSHPASPALFEEPPIWGRSDQGILFPTAWRREQRGEWKQGERKKTVLPVLDGVSIFDPLWSLQAT